MKEWFNRLINSEEPEAGLGRFFVGFAVIYFIVGGIFLLVLW